MQPHSSLQVFSDPKRGKDNCGDCAPFIPTKKYAEAVRYFMEATGSKVVYVASDNATEPGLMRSLLPKDAKVVTKDSFEGLMTVRTPFLLLALCTPLAIHTTPLLYWAGIL
jgi:hypothetical protein